MALYRTDDDPYFKFGSVVHIEHPRGPDLPVIVPRAMTYSEAQEYGAWVLARILAKQ